MGLQEKLTLELAEVQERNACAHLQSVQLQGKLNTMRQELEAEGLLTG